MISKKTLEKLAADPEMAREILELVAKYNPYARKILKQVNDFESALSQVAALSQGLHRKKFKLRAEIHTAKEGIERVKNMTLAEIRESVRKNCPGDDE